MLHSSLVVVLALCAGLAQGVDKKVVQPKGATPNAGWSHGLLVDGTLYVSGMGGEDATGKIPATFEAEVKQALDNIDAVLKEITGPDAWTCDGYEQPVRTAATR